MPPRDTIRALLAGATPQGQGDAARTATRLAWVKQAMAAWRAAQKRADDAWDRLLDDVPDDLSDDEFEAIPAPPEQADLAEIQAEVKAVTEHDRWPRELHWGGI